VKHSVIDLLGEDIYRLVEEPKNPQSIKNLSGQRFGRLTVLKFLGVIKLPASTTIRKCGYSTCSIWLCRCDCGKEIPAKGGDLRGKNVQSCGCMGNGCVKPKRKNQKYTADVAATLVFFLEPILAVSQLAHVKTILKKLNPAQNGGERSCTTEC
jgi:hypothetical protein